MDDNEVDGSALLAFVRCSAAAVYSANLALTNLDSWMQFTVILRQIWRRFDCDFSISLLDAVQAASDRCSELYWQFSWTSQRFFFE